MHRVKDRENKKVEKNEKEMSKENKIGTVQQKKKKAKFWLMRKRQSKMLYIFTSKFHQKLNALSENAFLPTFREMKDLRAKKID